jgi:hypothetical protein
MFKIKFSPVSNRNYLRSNKITIVKFPISAEAIVLAKEIIVSQETEVRQELGEKLLDELSDASKIEIVELKIQDDNQYHRRRNGKVVLKRYGSYRLASKTITIPNRTAVRGQIVAGKTFIDTLLHEWLHHYDTLKLKLNSIHTKGFYLRLSDLKIKLMIPVEKKK